MDNNLDAQRQAVFLQLKPLCVSLIQTGSVSTSKTHDIIHTINNLLNTLHSIPDSSRVFDYNLIKYVYIPLLQLYNNPVLQQSDRFVEGFLNCIHFLLTASWQKYMVSDQFKQLLILFVSIIGRSPSIDSKVDKQPFTLSEETKFVGVKCILALLPRHTELPGDVDERDQFQIEIRRELILQELMDIKLRALLARCVYVLLEIISNEKLLQLRLTSLETLQSLVNNIEDSGIIAAFLPGMVSTLSKTLVRDQKENHMLLTKIVETLSEVIASAMKDEDKVNESLLTKIDSLSDLKNLIPGTDQTSSHNLISNVTSTQSSQQQSIFASICVERTRSWLKATKLQIKILISQIFTIRNHSAWQLRLAFVKFSYKLLSCSAKCLDNCVPILIETLVFYLNDDYEQVSIPCRQNLNMLRLHSQFKNFTPILKENFDTWLTSLPRYLVGLDENAKFNALSLIAGFTSLLGSDIQTVLNFSLQRVSDGLLSALEFDTSDVQVVENRLIIGQYDSIEDEHTISSDFDSKCIVPSFSQPQYKHIREQRVRTCISLVLRLFGYFSNLSFLIDHFLAYFRDKEFKRFYAQCIFVIKEILLGAAGIDIGKTSSFEYSKIVMKPANALQDVKRIARSILREYIESDVIRGLINIDPATKAVFDSNRSKSVERKILATSNVSIESQNLIVLVNCFILEGIAAISRILGMEFRVELMDALYPILEKVGENNMLIHETADITLAHVSIWCGYSSKKALVLENVDYLVNVVSQKLNQVIVNPQTPQVLTAMIHVVGPPVLPFIDDSIEEIFDALDSYHMKPYLLNQLVNVLFAVIITISESVKKEMEEEQEEVNCNYNPLENEIEISKEIAEFVSQYKTENERETKTSRSNATLEEIGQYFLEHRESKKKLEETEYNELEDHDDNIKGEHDSTSASHNNEEDLDKKSNPTKSQLICLKIIDKLLHFLTASSPQLRSLVLDVIRISLPVLKSIPKELYPLVHRIWPSVLNRLKDQEPYVVLSAVRLIQGISISSGDFFTSRVVQDVWPSFQQLLRQQSVKDEDYSGIATTKYSRSHKLKKSILETMKIVISEEVLSNQILFQIMDNMWQFLSEEVHEELQNSAIELFKELAKRNADATWLILRGLVKEYSVITYNKIGDEEVELRDIIWPKYLCRFSKEKNQYVKNVKLILNANLF
ncbi:unnamed protein product [Rhizophagus irregularis]|nr:unnamed protein product [Rhizophagus irregularis]